MAAIDRALQGRSAGPAPPDSGDAAVSEKLASQQREIQRLKSILQQQQVALQKLGSGQQSYTGAADAARWQALLKEKEATLTQLRKLAIAEHQKMNHQINHLRAQLTEKEARVANLQHQISQAGLAADGQSEGADFFAQLQEKEKAMAQAEKLVKTLTEKIAAQQQDIEMHRNEAERLARELHVLATGIQMLGQSLSDQAGEISPDVSGEK
jgi:chromosome segregation ATPase